MGSSGNLGTTRYVGFNVSGTVRKPDDDHATIA
jgi:hypothetical protein